MNNDQNVRTWLEPAPTPTLAYICCGGSAKVAIVNLTTASHTGDIPLPENSYPYYIVTDPSNRYAYVADYTRKMVLQLDLLEQRMIRQTPVAGTPVGLDVSPCGNYVYVVFADVPVMAILDDRLESTNLVRLPAIGRSVAITNQGCRAYVTLPELNQTAVINLCSFCVVGCIATGQNPSRMTYSPEDQILLIAGLDSQTLTPVNTCQLEIYDDILLSSSPAGIAFTEGMRQCIVAFPQDNGAMMVNLLTGLENAFYATGNVPGGVAASFYQPLAVVCNQISSTISIINTRLETITATLHVGDAPLGAAVTN